MPIEENDEKAEQPKEVEIFLDPNGDEIKLKWRVDASALSKPVKLDAELLRKRASEVRRALGGMNEYVLRNPNMDQARDVDWKLYREALRGIRQAGQALRLALFHQAAGAVALEEILRAMPEGTLLKIHCSDEEVTFPFGFVCEAGRFESKEGPSLKDFVGFWLVRFRISMLIDGAVCDEADLTVNPDTLRTLYALHEEELEASAEYLGADRKKLEQLLGHPVGRVSNWDDAQDRWASIDTSDGIVFVLAHSDGDHLRLKDSNIESVGFKALLQKPSGAGATLLILNCCLSATGGNGASLLSAVAQKGFCGLVGTEAEILNAAALRFGTLLLWRLCMGAESLGEAFDALQRDEKLFPLNLFYTCYADRAFKLRGPMELAV